MSCRGFPRVFTAEPLAGAGGVLGSGLGSGGREDTGGTWPYCTQSTPRSNVEGSECESGRYAKSRSNTAPQTSYDTRKRSTLPPPATTGTSCGISSGFLLCIGQQTCAK